VSPRVEEERQDITRQGTSRREMKRSGMQGTWVRNIKRQEPREYKRGQKCKEYRQGMQTSK
jgi:hypothetical protein